MSNSLTLKFWFDWWDSGTILFTSALQAALARLYDNVAFSAVFCAGKFADIPRDFFPENSHGRQRRKAAI